MDTENTEIIKVLCDLIRVEMNLKPDRIFIYNQKYTLPTDDGLFVDVAFLESKPFGSSLKYEAGSGDTAGQLIESQIQTVQETYSVNLFSRDDSARLRKQEVVFALHSTIAQQLCEKYSFKFAFIPSGFVDASAVEASARLNRYSITFNLFRGFSRKRRVEYFTQFQTPKQSDGSLLTNP